MQKLYLFHYFGFCFVHERNFGNANHDNRECNSFIMHSTGVQIKISENLQTKKNAIYITNMQQQRSHTFILKRNAIERFT